MTSLVEEPKANLPEESRIGAVRRMPPMDLPMSLLDLPMPPMGLPYTINCFRTRHLRYESGPRRNGKTFLPENLPQPSFARH